MLNNFVVQFRYHSGGLARPNDNDWRPCPNQPGSGAPCDDEKTVLV